MALELARPSEAWCFPPRQVIFSKLFYCSSRRQQKLSKKCCFSRISDAPAGDFFEAVLLQQPQATEAVEKGCFSRSSEESLGTFSAPFRGFSALHCHGVWGWRVQCFRGLEGVSFELLSSFFRTSFLGFQTTR